MKDKKARACFLVLILLALSLFGVKVKIISKSSYKEFQKGTFQNISVWSTGRIALGPKYKAVQGPGEEFYFSLCTGKSGEVYLGTGHDCSIYKVAPSGTSEKVWKGENLDVHALLVDGNGDIIAGTSPNGKVVRIAAKDKKVTTLFDPDERFIWDLKEDDQGNILCAVGNGGGVYSITPAGQVEPLFSGEDSHIVSLFVTRDNSVLAGSGDRGVLYQIKNRKVKVLYDSNLDEIRGICEDGDGNIYFAAMRSMLTARTSKDFEFGATFRKSRAEEKTEIKEKSILYRLGSDGVTEEVWSSDEEYAYTLAYDQASRSLLMGTGNSGRVYRVEANGDFSLILESDSAQMYKIVGVQGGFLAMADNSAALLQVDGGWSSTGAYFSDVHDAKIASRFGKMEWDSDAPAGTSVSLSVRYGNSDNPDSSWTAWSAPFADPEGSNLDLAGYRFLQVRATLGSQKPSLTPALLAYRIHYLEANREPILQEIIVSKLSTEEKKNKGKEGEEAARKGLKVSWVATDPNQDQLLFRVSLRKVTDSAWLTIAQNLTDKSYVLDSEMYEDGKYRVQVEASDAPDNSPSLAKKATLVSSPFLIDSTAPVIVDWQRRGANVAFQVKDETSSVRQVLYSFEGKHWFSLFPEDLVTDSKSETFSVQVPDLDKYPYVFIKVVDEFDNQKVYQKQL